MQLAVAPRGAFDLRVFVQLPQFELRADLERVAKADRYADGSIRRVELLEQIRGAPPVAR